MERVVVPDPARGSAPSARRQLRFAAAGSTHAGAVRDHNEDFVFAGENLVAVADGVGGSVYGEVASAVVVNAIAYLEDRIYRDDPERDVTQALRYAEERLVAAVAEDPRRDGMATTLTALRLDGAAVVVAHVGDSRAYRLRAGEWRQLTRDDSLVQDLVDAGAITAGEALRHPARSVVMQALGSGRVAPYVAALEAAVGDRYLVCSDGLSDYVAAADIARLVQDAGDPAAGCDALVAAALAVGAPDNVSCVVADVRPL
jgi:protein phosphatase